MHTDVNIANSVNDVGSHILIRRMDKDPYTHIRIYAYTKYAD